MFSCLRFKSQECAYQCPFSLKDEQSRVGDKVIRPMITKFSGFSNLPTIKLVSVYIDFNFNCIVKVF